MTPHHGSSPRSLDRFISLIERAPGSDRLLLRLAFFGAIVGAIWLIFAFNQQFSADTPVRGGSFTEGVIGTPRFVNPTLAATRADQDVTALIYSGLMRIDPSGTLVNDIAESITTSEDGQTYNVIVRKDITFHDGTPLTARDVAYTIRLIQDPDLKSPLRGNWNNVTVEEIGEYELNIVLEEAYAPFTENFTVGIMPAHLWSSLPTEQLPFSQLNTEPIGSGPFMITSAKRDTSGLISHYTLTAFEDNPTVPRIDHIELAFFSNEEQLLTAIAEKEVDATAYITNERIDQATSSGLRLIEEPLPRSFGIFFNQNRSSVLRDEAARAALAAALDRDALIENALFGYGVPITAPTVLVHDTVESGGNIDTLATSTPLAHAADLLTAGDWSKNELGLWEKEIDDTTTTLQVTVRTSNVPLFNDLLSGITDAWQELGVDVITEQFEQTALVQSVIRPRDYQALLFGLDMSRSYDLYPFWHSSQQDDPGLNIAQYANVEVDALLETARTEQDAAARTEALSEASGVIMAEHPAIFLFQPTMVYVVGPDMHTTDITRIGRPSDRFSNIAEWHTESESLWPIFRSNDM